MSYLSLKDFVMLAYCWLFRLKNVVILEQNLVVFDTTVLKQNKTRQQDKTLTLLDLYALITHLYPVPRLRMSGAIPSLHLHKFTACTGTPLP